MDNLKQFKQFLKKNKCSIKYFKTDDIDKANFLLISLKVYDELINNTKLYKNDTVEQMKYLLTTCKISDLKHGDIVIRTSSDLSIYKIVMFYYNYNNKEGIVLSDYSIHDDICIVPYTLTSSFDFHFAYWDIDFDQTIRKTYM